MSQVGGLACLPLVRARAAHVALLWHARRAASGPSRGSPRPLSGSLRPGRLRAAVVQGSPTLRTLSKETYRHALAVTGERPPCPSRPPNLSGPWAAPCPRGCPCLWVPTVQSDAACTDTLSFGCAQGMCLLSGVDTLAFAERAGPAGAPTASSNECGSATPSPPAQPCGPAWAANPSCTRSTSAARRSCGTTCRRALRPAWRLSGGIQGYPQKTARGCVCGWAADMCAWAGRPTWRGRPAKGPVCASAARSRGKLPAQRAPDRPAAFRTLLQAAAYYRSLCRP